MANEINMDMVKTTATHMESLQQSPDVMLNLRHLAWNAGSSPTPTSWFRSCQANLEAMSLRLVNTEGWDRPRMTLKLVVSILWDNGSKLAR